MAVIIPSTKEIQNICILIDTALDKYLQKRPKYKIGKFESETTAFINIIHAIRLLDSIIELAKKDLVFIQGALVMSRAAFEVLVKTIWILMPENKMDCESRFVAYLRTECSFLEKWAKELKNITNTEQVETLVRLNSYQKFEQDLTTLLKDKGYEVPTSVPNVRELLKSINEERKYLYYILLSQYTHFSHFSATLYQKNLGINKEINESANLDMWKLVFAATWPIFEFTTELFIISMGISEELYSKELKEAIRNAINLID